MSANNPSDIPMATPRAQTATTDKHITASATSAYTGFDATLQGQLGKDFVGQTTLMNEVAKTLLTLQLAIPSIFAAVLKLVAGKDAILSTAGFPQNLLVIIPFVLWFLALVFTLLALSPKRYRVDPHLLKSGDSNAQADTANNVTDVYSFYRHSAENKFLYITGSSVLTLLGVGLMVFGMLML